MKIQGKQLADTLRSESTPFDVVYASETIGSLNGNVRFKCKNGETFAMSKGQAVYISGVSGDVPLVKLADADSVGAMPCVGLTESAANSNAEVHVISFGNLAGIDTDSLDGQGESIVGKPVYVTNTPGELSITKPTGSNSKLQNIGQIIRQHGSNGIIKVGGAGRTAATPNLDDGHFFVGNTSNESTQSTYQLPTAIGTSGQVLASDGTNVTFQDASKSYTTSFVGDSDFNATDNTFYFVNTTSGNTTSITLPDRGTDTSLEYRFKFFNHGDGLLRIMELNNPGLIDPSEDGSTPSNIGSSYKFFNSRCLIEVFSIVGTSHYEWIVSSQLELGKETLSADGEVLRYNASTDQMVALPYTFPTSAGTSGQVLASDGTNVTFQDASTGGMTVETKTADFSAEFDHLYIVDGSAGSTIEVSVPVSHIYQNGFTDFIGSRIKIFNKGDGVIRLREYNSNTAPNLDPTADGATTWRIVNSRALIELVCTEIYKIEYVIIPQLELDESTLTTTGEVFAYNSYEKAMTALPYIFPTADSTEGKVLQTDGNGTLTFETISEVQLADKINYVNYVKGTTSTYNPNYNYLAGTTMTADETLVMPIANAGTATLNDLQNKVTEIVNMSGYILTLSWSNVNVNNDYYTSVYDETGEVSPYTGSFSYQLAASKVYRIFSWYTYNSGTQKTFLNYRITALN